MKLNRFLAAVSLVSSFLFIPMVHGKTKKNRSVAAEESLAQKNFQIIGDEAENLFNFLMKASKQSENGLIASTDGPTMRLGTGTVYTTYVGTNYGLDCTRQAIHPLHATDNDGGDKRMIFTCSSK